MAQLTEKRLPATRTAGRFVLLVDDNADHRELYARRLRRLGYPTRTASSGMQAIATMREAVPDVVVLDIAMPGRDGLSVLQELIALWPALPVIIHTAYPSYCDNFLSWAANAYVLKSPDIGPLADALGATVGRPAVA